VSEGSAIDRFLTEQRRLLPRRPPASEVEDLLAAGALLVDIRPAHQRQRDGDLPGALVVDRNVLEWRLDPTSPYRLREAGDGERQVVVVCDEGYASSLAAAALQRLGLHRATDLDGGYQAWRRWQARAEGVMPGPPPAG
jgi:rhodanese-related sulfurtransferase